MRRTFPKQVVYAFFIIIPFGLIFFNSPRLHHVKMTMMSLGAGSVSFVRAPVEEINHLLSYHKTWEDYQKLKREVGAVKARVVALEEEASQNKRYARLLGLKERSTFSMEAALVIARDPANWNSSLLINKGSADGLRIGMAAVNSSGVVGKVAEVARSVSKIILINDPGFGVAVVNERSRESGLLSGSLSGVCRLNYLPDDADIRVGDEMVTSSLSDSFPEGLRVGSVSAVYPGETGTPPRAIVEPIIEASKIEEVLIIK